MTPPLGRKRVSGQSWGGGGGGGEGAFLNFSQKWKSHQLRNLTMSVLQKDCFSDFPNPLAHLILNP